MKSFKKKKISLLHQMHAIRENYPLTETISINALQLIWIGYLKPTPLSETYKVKVIYELGDSPKTWVLDPPLRKRGTEDIPHMYSQERLCLFLPGEGSWRSDKYIAGTIIPWISEWLYFYEMWHVTGKWLGGGIHPRSSKKESKISE